MAESHQNTKRYLGLELSGAKNQKTALAVLEFFVKEEKIFLLDVFDKIAPLEDENSDEALLGLIREENQGVATLAVNVPLTLPPCITCDRKQCSSSKGWKECASPDVRWMKRFCRQTTRGKNKTPIFTAYTQRPIELWIRYKVLPELPEESQFEVDETLGGNRAPLTARMHYLKKFLNEYPLIEVWPKLSVAMLCHHLGLPSRVASSYRHLDQGAHFREEILASFIENYDIFIYERDLRKLSISLTAFDAFICALTALLYDQGECVKIPKGFPAESGWVQYPVA
jgi:hypothetical protein